jgi:hypothetical protein
MHRQQYVVQIWNCQFCMEVFMFSRRGLLSSYTLWCSGPQIFHKSSSHLKIPGARMVTSSKFHTDNPKILGATVQNLVAMAIWQPGSVHPRCSVMCLFRHSSETSEHTHTAWCNNPDHHFTPPLYIMVNNLKKQLKYPQYFLYRYDTDVNLCKDVRATGRCSIEPEQNDLYADIKSYMVYL